MGDYSETGIYGYSSSDVRITEDLPSIKDCVESREAVKTTPGEKNNYNDVVFFEVERLTGEYRTVSEGTGEKFIPKGSKRQTEYRDTIIDIQDQYNVLINEHIVFDDDLTKLIEEAKTRGKTDSCYVSQVMIFNNNSYSNDYEVAKTFAQFLNQKSYLVDQNGKGWDVATLGMRNKALGSIGNVYDNILVFPQMTKRTVFVRHINIGDNTTISTSIINSSERIESNNLTIKVGDTTKEGKADSDTYRNYDYEEYYEEIADVDKQISKVALANTDKYNCIGYNVSTQLTHEGAIEEIAALIAKGEYTSAITDEGEYISEIEVTIPGKTSQADRDYTIIDFYYTEHADDVEVNHYYTDKNGIVKEAVDSQTIVPNTTANNGTVSRINNDRYIKEVYHRKLGQDIEVEIANSICANINTNNECSDSITYQGYQIFTKQDIADGKIVGLGEQGHFDNTETTATLSEDKVQVNFYYTIENTTELTEPERTLGGKLFVNRQKEDGEEKNFSTTCTDTTESGQGYDVRSIPSGSLGKVGIKDIPKYMVGAITSEYVSPASKLHRMNLTIKLTMGRQEDKTIKLEDIPYRVGYYKITDMAVYKLNDANVYDAGAKGVDTFGDGLFDWENKKLTVSKMNSIIEMTGINGKTITNSTIDNINNYVAIKVSGISPATNETIVSEQPFRSDKDDTFGTYDLNYINEEEFDKVDANGDLAITDTIINEQGEKILGDKDFAEAKLQDHYEQLEVAIYNEQVAHDEYDATHAVYIDLEQDYNNAEEELENRRITYSTADNERITKESELREQEEYIDKLKNETIPNLEKEIAGLESEIAKLDGEIAGLESEIATLNGEIARLESEIATLDGEIAGLESDIATLDGEIAGLESDIATLNREIAGLESDIATLDGEIAGLEYDLDNIEESQEYIDWQNSIVERQNLYDAAQCDDAVDKNEHIYLTESEKEALAKCREAKDAYQSNIDGKVVENAEETYSDYLYDIENALDEFARDLEDKKSKKEENIETQEGYIADRTTKISERDSKAADRTTKISERDSKAADRTTKISERDSKAADRITKTSERDSKNSELFNEEVLYGILSNAYYSFKSETWQPAMNAYFSYRDEPNSEYNIAKDKYEEYIPIDKEAYDNWQDKLAIKKEKQTNYDAYKAYRDRLFELYDGYKAMYDEFITLTDENAAEELSLDLSITVENMSIKFRIKNEQEKILTNSTKNSVTESFEVKELQKITDEDDKNIPQVYTDPIKIDKQAYQNVFYDSDKKPLITEADYNAMYNDYIKKEILNGVRVLAGDVEYSPVTVIGGKEPLNIVDNLYYNQEKTTSDEDINIFNMATEKITKKYQWNKNATSYEEKYKDVDPVNIYTPITVSAVLNSDKDSIVDQTNLDLNTSMIQLNTPFKIELRNRKKEINYEIDNTNRFVKGYYIKFDFEVYNVYINGKKYKNGNRISPNAWLKFILPELEDEDTGEYYAIVEAQAYGNLDGEALDIVSEDHGTYTVRAVAYNATDIMRNESIRYATLEEMTQEQSNLKNIVDNICTNPSYFDQTEIRSIIIINRTFDFKVTDVKDLNWKSVFRKKTGSNVNAHSGVVYHSGTTKWDTSSDKTNTIIPRTTSEIGKNPLRTLPIGPYKNTNTTYVKAPKMGYRFSFDLKTTGSYYDKNGKPRKNKKVDISTTFYYISKDGKTYLKESDGNSEGIYLFYKNANGKYIRIDQNGGGYKLTFTPNDGYRYLEYGDKLNLSKSELELGNLRKLTLTHEMATIANNGVIITYYGEYKLPNSTIAVEVTKDEFGNIHYDVNKPLKNGYIGVIFDMGVYSGTVEKEVILSYSKNTNPNKANTSQWDYEGYLGYKNYGNPVAKPLSIKLEKGVWKLDNTIYNDIKGTVILYDLDERASTDYE